MMTKIARRMVMLAALATAAGGCGHGRSLVGEAKAGDVRAGTVEIPFNTHIVARLDRSLCTATNFAGDAFALTTLADIVVDGRVVLVAGTVIDGRLCDVHAAGLASWPAQMTLSFSQLTDADGCVHALTAEAVALRAAGKSTAVAVAGGDAGADAVIGPGSVNGSEVILARQGQDVSLAAGSKVCVRLTSPVRVGMPAQR